MHGRGRQDDAHHRPVAWTAESVNVVASAHVPVRVTGQLFFDSSHVPCNGHSRVRANPARASLWEIHPIYSFDVCVTGCGTDNPSWQSVDQWLAGRHGPRKKGGQTSS